MGGKGGKRNEKRSVSKTGLKGEERETNSESGREGKSRRRDIEPAGLDQWFPCRGRADPHPPDERAIGNVQV